MWTMISKPSWLETAPCQKFTIRISYLVLSSVKMLQIIVGNTYLCFLRTYLINKEISLLFYCYINNNHSWTSMPLWLYSQFTWVRYNQGEMKCGLYSHSCKNRPISSLDWIIVPMRPRSQVLCMCRPRLYPETLLPQPVSLPLSGYLLNVCL